MGYWSTDKLTGLLNRWGWDDAAQDTLDRARGRGHPVALLIIDLDCFKRVNDEFGHLVGDAVLQASAGVLRASIRDGDLAGRFGGDEFLGLLPGVYPAAALAVAERIRDGISRIRVRVGVDDGSGAGVTGCTASIGVAGGALLPGVDMVDLLRRADAALRDAKLAGGDRIRAADPLPGTCPHHRRLRLAQAGQRCG
ncbi:GGDEF domain-containing protein [Planosporangium thailandense]|uniref:GGDEF domain-containing protein n=1 Tax=Planosporangium thailandense TaxID=765197 RepID=A0ABX0XZC4_9ACTN|nr:GGDEF domain-containing protein [Planosporangium thailandense]